MPSAAAAPAPAATTPTSPPLHTPYGDSMRDVVRFLLAVGSVTPSPGADLSAAFRDVWGKTGSPATSADMHASMQRIYNMNPDHLGQVFASLDGQTRQYFHAQAIQMSQAVKADMPELAQASALMRWILQHAMPRLQGQPEEAQLGTTPELRKNYAALDLVCKIARPDSSNPKVAELEAMVHAAQAQHAAASQQSEGYKTRLAALGFDPDTPEDQDKDAVAAADQDKLASMCKKKSRTTVIVSIVLGVLLIVAVITFVVLWLKKCKHGGGSTAALGAAGPPAVGGVFRTSGGFGNSGGGGGRGGGGGGGFRLPASPPALGVDDWGFPPLGERGSL